MVRSWVKLIWNSLGVAVVAAAAQLGAAQALGIVRWTNPYQPGGGDSWSALLTWIVFIYAVSVLGGASVGRRAVRRPGRWEATLVRVIAALSAAVGAAGAIGLAMIQARGAVPPVNVHPDLLVALVAAAGVVAGLILAVVALFVPPVAGGVRASVAWIWLAAIGSALPELITHRPAASPELGVFDLPSLRALSWWPGPYVMIVVAGLLGLAVALVARWGGAHRVGIALSGLAGPAIIAGSYAIAGIGDGDRTAFLASLYAAGAGLVLATLVALPARDGPREEAGPVDQSWTEADRYRPGNYLAESRPGEVTPSPFRIPAEANSQWADLAQGDPSPHSPQPTEQAYPGGAGQPEPARSGAHRAEAYPGGTGRTYGASGYLGREYRDYDYPTDEYPTATTVSEQPPGAPVMGQPPQDQSEWLRSLGSAPAQRGANN